MKVLSVKNIRDAILSIECGNRNLCRLRQISNEELSDCDFYVDLQMRDYHVEELIYKLNNLHSLRLPREIRKVTANNTVRSFIDTANMYIKELAALKDFMPHLA